MRPLAMLPFLLLVFCFVPLADAGLGILGTTQAAAVRGVLVCNGRPSVGTKVKLYDEDDTDMDDLMDEGVTDGRGFFQLSGSIKEMTTIDPKLNVYHDCNDGVIPCQKKFSIKIPDEYVSKGTVARRVFDAGTINLDGSFSGQTRDCVN